MIRLDDYNYDIKIRTQIFDERKQLIRVGNIDLLVGREEECHKLKLRARLGGHNIIIHGPLGYGKTTMLYWFADYINKQEGKLAVFADTIVKNESHYYYVICKAIANELIRREGEVDPTLSTYAKYKLRDLGKYHYGSGFKYETIYKKLLFALRNAGYEDIYIFGDDYNHFWEDRFFLLRNYLKSLFSREENGVLWVITMQTKYYRKLGVEDAAFLDRFGERIMLHTLSIDEGKEIIRRRLLAAVDDKLRIKYGEWYPFTEEAVEKISEQSRGIPRDLLKFTRVILDYAIGTDKIRSGELIDVDFVKKVLESKGLDIDTEVYKGLGEKAYKIIRFLEKNGGCAKLSEIALEIKSSKELASYWLKKLVMEGFVSKAGYGTYCLSKTIEEGVGLDEVSYSESSENS